MPVVACSLPHPLHLVIPPARFQKMAAEYPEATALGHPQLKAELQALSASGVPTLVGEAWDKRQITFCTGHYEIACGLTHQEDGYYVQHIAPLSLRSHNQLAQQMIALKAPDWYLHWEVADLGRWARQTGTLPQSGLERIETAWQQAEGLKSAASTLTGTLSPAHLNFLAEVETLIDLAYQVELEQAIRRGPTAVVGTPQPLAQGRSAGDVYCFQVATAPSLRVGDYVKAGFGEPGEQKEGYVGVVTEVTPQTLAVRFHHPVDLSRLKRVAWLLPWASSRQYDIQKAALAALRMGQSANPHVLRFIVDGSVEPYPEKPGLAQGLEQLNPAQQRLIARAGQVPDLLLALGPPGTGKTHTIRALVGQQAAQGKRILITSKSNKAVDNVLEGLEEVDALRIGREEAVSAGARRLMIEARARELQGQILTKITPTLSGLDDVQALWPQLQERLSHLSHGAAEWRSIQANYEGERQAFQEWQQSRYSDVARVLERQRRHLDALRQQAAQATHQAARWRTALTRLWPLTGLPGLGPLFMIAAAWLDRRWQEAANAYRQAAREAGRTAGQIRHLWQSYHHTVTAGEEALRRKGRIAQQEEALASLQTLTRQEVDQLFKILARFEQSPFLENVPSLGRAWESPEALAAVAQEFKAWYAASLPRRSLLHDWHELLQTRPQALHPTLIRTVEVVGATCIGIATDANFEDLEFDLVIADEAGQIPVMDLLVPLVRAKRAILVGDHRQLPPVVEAEIARRVDPDEERQRAWLEQSLFEQLFERQCISESHKVMLDTQYRMPRPIADFISHQFYEGKYQTGRDLPHTDPFFTTPLVFIDTMEVKERRERPAIEPEGIRGYINELEARLTAQVVLAYQAQGEAWGVIVPYKNQAELIRRELRPLSRSFSTDCLNDGVATVDSFQGKEREVIIYGFTRSNPRGQVGFMAELRRLNVSLTRARRQLVLIGDSTTLARAADAPFARLVGTLLQTVKTVPGGYLHAGELQQRLKC